jgi:hypothetical protein
MLRASPDYIDGLIDLTEQLIGERPSRTQMSHFHTYHLRDTLGSQISAEAIAQRDPQLREVPQKLLGTALKIRSLGSEAFAQC